MNKFINCLIFCSGLLISQTALSAVISYVDIDSSTSTVSLWNGDSYGDVYTVEGQIEITVDTNNYIYFNFENVATIPVDQNLSSPFAPDLAYDSASFDNRGQYACTGTCLPVVYDEIWGTYDGLALAFQGSGGAYGYQFSITGTTAAVVPIPAASILFLSSFIGLIGFSKRKHLKTDNET